jgi:hypothetical protein
MFWNDDVKDKFWNDDVKDKFWNYDVMNMFSRDDVTGCLKGARVDPEGANQYIQSRIWTPAL